MIEVKNLVKRYGDHYAVNHLSFTVEDGQIFGFLGPNGAGKSTTMNIMTGYLAATEGQVLVEGHDILEEPEAARACIGYLPEIPPLYPDMTVEEYLRFCAELKKIPKEQRTDQLTKVLALTHLEDMSARLIRNLSKGYRQRVGLAQAILGFPKIIILDEPTVGLDPKQVVEIRDLIRHLAKDHTVILSSHILSDLAATEGQVLVEGHDILEEPEAARACIGYLPEIPPLYPDMTVEEYLRFCAELKKIPKEQRTDQLTKVLALTHLEDMSARLIRNLSKGYRQRVGLAQAILGFPKIIILDEPTVGLDPKQVVEIRDLIRHLAKDHTVILSSHILSEIRAVCDRVLIIRKGRFVVCDTPEDLEEKLSAGGSLELTAKAAPEAAEAVLDRVAGITGRTLLGRTEDTARFAIHMERDIREALFFAFAEAGLPLLELRPRTASLEEVFLDLTDDNDTVAARAAALFQTSVETAEKEAVGDESDL